MRNRNLGNMDRRSLVAFAGDPSEDLGSLPHVGVVFFPRLPFMGVMLFPSFRLGNASGDGGASLALLSLFFILLLPPLFFLSSFLFSLSSSLFSFFLLFNLFFHVSFSPFFVFFFA